MADRSEEQRQALIAVLQVADEGQPADRVHLHEAREYFGRYVVTWDEALPALVGQGLLAEQDGVYTLTPAGAAEAARERAETPEFWYFYSAFYGATRDSRAYASFCEQAYGANFTQHGFADMGQLERLLAALRPAPGSRMLDVGCGNGAMDAYFASATGAHVTGIDYIPEAIRQAQARAEARGQAGQLDFRVAHMERLDFPPDSFDTIIAIDTFYFADIDETLRRLLSVLAPGGQMGVLYLVSFPPEETAAANAQGKLRPEATPLGEALARLGLAYDTLDLTHALYEHCQRMGPVLDALRPEFEAEGTLSLYQPMRDAAAHGVAAYERGGLARYLYYVH